MTYSTQLPTEVGTYRHRWDFKGQMREQVLFVGYVNASAPRLQGREPNSYMPRKLRCCPPDELARRLSRPMSGSKSFGPVFVTPAGMCIPGLGTAVSAFPLESSL